MNISCQGFGAKAPIRQDVCNFITDTFPVHHSVTRAPFPLWPAAAPRQTSILASYAWICTETTKMSYSNSQRDKFNLVRSLLLGKNMEVAQLPPINFDNLPSRELSTSAGILFYRGSNASAGSTYAGHCIKFESNWVGTLLWSRSSLPHFRHL